MREVPYEQESRVGSGVRMHPDVRKCGTSLFYGEVCISARRCVTLLRASRKPRVVRVADNLRNPYRNSEPVPRFVTLHREVLDQVHVGLIRALHIRQRGAEHPSLDDVRLARVQAALDSTLDAVNHGIQVAP